MNICLSIVTFHIYKFIVLMVLIYDGRSEKVTLLCRNTVKKKIRFDDCVDVITITQFALHVDIVVLATMWYNYHGVNRAVFMYAYDATQRVYLNDLRRVRMNHSKLVSTLKLDGFINLLIIRFFNPACLRTYVSLLLG